MPLSRDDVVRAAVQVIDDDGLAGLTLRGLATRLGVSAPTLYWHVSGKRHLLDLVAEHVLAEVPGTARPIGPDEPVWEWLADGLRIRRRVLLAHRDSVLVVAGNRPTADAMPQVERTLGVLVGAGLEPGEAVRVLTALGSFLLGDVLETQSARDRDPDGPVPQRAVPPIVATAWATVGGDDERFEEGLALMLGGLRARLESRAAAGSLPD